MNFNTALKLFEHTLAQAERARPEIHAGMRKLADPATIELANAAVSTGLALGQRIWLTSDLHLGHANIIGYCDRPFGDAHTMNEALVSLLAKVDADSVLVILGDLAMGDHDQAADCVRRIPGRKILVVGNHDFTRAGQCRWRTERDAAGEPLFTHVVPFLFWPGPHGRSVLATHYPVSPPKDHKAPLLNYHGHLHRQVLAPTETVKYMNVGWDVDYCLRCL